MYDHDSDGGWSWDALPHKRGLTTWQAARYGMYAINHHSGLMFVMYCSRKMQHCTTTLSAAGSHVHAFSVVLVVAPNHTGIRKPCTVVVAISGRQGLRDESLLIGDLLHNNYLYHTAIAVTVIGPAPEINFRTQFSVLECSATYRLRPVFP